MQRLSFNAAEWLARRADMSVLSAEPVLRRPIYLTLLKRGVGAALVVAQRGSLQTPQRILSLRGTRTQYSKDSENEFHGHR